MKLTTAIKERAEMQAELAAITKAFAEESSRLNTEIMNRTAILSVAHHGLDLEKVELAESVMYVTDYRKGGSDWRTCITDAVKQIGTGKAESHYLNLWIQYFGTKDYDRWNGQRSDHDYGYGPRHGSKVFSVGLNPETRARTAKTLTPEETEACVYYLLNVVLIQDAKRIPAEVSP